MEIQKVASLVHHSFPSTSTHTLSQSPAAYIAKGNVTEHPTTSKSQNNDECKPIATDMENDCQTDASNIGKTHTGIGSPMEISSEASLSLYLFIYTHQYTSHFFK